MAVSWAWAHNRFARYRSRSSGSSGGGSGYGNSFASNGSIRSSHYQTSFQSSGSTNGTPRPSHFRDHMRTWSKPSCLDDAVDELEKQLSDCGILIHTEDRGYTEHVNNVAAIEYLKCLVRERRQPNLPLGHRKPSLATQGVRRRPRSAAPRPLILDEKEFSGLHKCATVTGALSETIVEDEQDEQEAIIYVPGAGAKGSSKEVSSDAETCVPSDDERKLQSEEERLRDLQLVLDAASPNEFVGLDVILGGDQGTVKAYSPEKGFVVALKSGADVPLARIEASHVLGCMPEWA